MPLHRVSPRAVWLAGAVAILYRLVVSGALTLDTGVGRRTRPLGPIRVDVTSAPEVVFDVVAEPYLGKTPKALAGKLNVLDRGSDMVLAEHFTEVGKGLTATTVETVRFERPRYVHFRLLRGPVPYVVETFELEPSGTGTTFTYTGEMGADFWVIGQWWVGKVADRWERAVKASLDSLKAEAERRASVSGRTAGATAASKALRSAPTSS